MEQERGPEQASGANPSARVADVGAYIREQRRKARMSLRKLSEAAGVSNPYLSQIERGLRQPSVRILQGIAKGLRVSAETLYAQAGILEQVSGDNDVLRVIYRDPGLTEGQRRALAEMYERFRIETVERRAKHSERRLRAAGDDLA
jgi:transcriptional regulator with XRE-family HTH domain